MTAGGGTPTGRKRRQRGQTLLQHRPAATEVNYKD